MTTLFDQPARRSFDLVADDDVGKVFATLWEPGDQANLFPMVGIELRFTVPLDLGLTARGDRRVARIGWRRPTGDEGARVDLFLPRALLRNIPPEYRIADEGISGTFHAFAARTGTWLMRDLAEDALRIARVLDERRRCVPPARPLRPWLPAAERVATELGLSAIYCPLGVEGWIGRPATITRSVQATTAYRAPPPPRPTAVPLHWRFHFVRVRNAYTLAMRVRPERTSSADVVAPNFLSRDRCPRGVALLGSLVPWGQLTFVEHGFDLLFAQVPTPELFCDIARATHVGLTALGEELFHLAAA